MSDVNNDNQKSTTTPIEGFFYKKEGTLFVFRKKGGETTVFLPYGVGINQIPERAKRVTFKPVEDKEKGYDVSGTSEVVGMGGRVARDQIADIIAYRKRRILRQADPHRSSRSRQTLFEPETKTPQ